MQKSSNFKRKFYINVLRTKKKNHWSVILTPLYVFNAGMLLDDGVQRGVDESYSDELGL